MWILIAIIIVGLLIYGVSAANKIKKQHEAENATFTGAHQGWEIYVSAFDRGVLALDHDRRRLAVGTVTNHVEVAWSAINSVEIEKNGQSIQQTNRGSQVMGAAVGAVLLGPLGLLVGGLTGSKRQRERVSDLSLKILIDERSEPVHRISFFRMAGNGVDSNSPLLKEPARRLEHFHALLANAIRSDHRATFAPQFASADGVESRIGKLWELYQAGALTHEEFQAQKLMLLGSTTMESSKQVDLHKPDEWNS
ncbi:MAG TPA: hypothetical protein VF662_09255 [Allosphingosinicella sp.]|jgi:hypothetical protein